MTHLEIEKLSKTFGDPEDGGVVAVDNLSIDVPAGDLLVLLGPSGCGKTTTLRMIGGLEQPTGGEIKFDGTVVNGIKARNRDVAMVFQDFALYPHMTIKENLSFGLQRGDSEMTSEEIENHVTQTAEMLEIESLLDNKPNQLSGGQKQRVALGRAIVREPQLFLFDEPLANLDAQLRKTMRTEIVELQSQVGITSAYVTHNQEEAMTIADKIAILNHGELQQLGSPDEVFNEPVNLFVAQFVGSPDMNLYQGKIADQGDDYQVEMDGMTFDIPKRLVNTDIRTDKVLLGFRPQDLYQSHNESAGGLAVDTDIRVVEPVGTEAIIHGETATDDITAKVGDFQGLSKGESLSLTIAPEHIYLFDAQTEELLKGRLVVKRAEESSANRAEV